MELTQLTAIDVARKEFQLREETRLLDWGVTVRGVELSLRQQLTHFHVRLSNANGGGHQRRAQTGALIL